MLLRVGNGSTGREAEWVMLFIKCSKNECVPDYRMYKKNTITYPIVDTTC